MVPPRIVCKTGRYYGQEEKKSEHVYVTVALYRTAKSKEMFTYVVSTINSKLKVLRIASEMQVHQSLTY